MYIALWYVSGRRDIVIGKGRTHGLDSRCHLCATSLSTLITQSLFVAGNRYWASEWKPLWGGLSYTSASVTLAPTSPVPAARIWQHVLWSTFNISLSWSPLDGKVWFISHGSSSADLMNVQGNGKGWRRGRETGGKISLCMIRRWILEVDC